MERHEMGDDVEMKLSQLFRKNKNKSFVFFKPNKGNWGDSLIRQGAKKLAYIYDIDYEEKDKIENFNRDIIYIHGVGGIGKTYPNVASKVVELRKHNPYSMIVFGPTTAMIHPEQLKKEFPNKDDNFIFFAREKITFKFMKNHFDFKIYIDECPSLCLEEGNLPVYSDGLFKILILRDDKFEKVPMPKKLKKEYFDYVCDPADEAKSFESWVDAHSQAREIVTNRCHSAILGVILGKKVRIFKNNYHKNRSIYEYSLKRRGVKWIS